MKKIALFGAGGKMGMRISANLINSDYALLCVENGEAGKARLAARGLAVSPPDEAARAADAVILAVPDARIGAVAAAVVPALKPGALLVLLDPAAAYMGELPLRDDIGCLISHPCHPPVFNDETDPEAKRDYFGGVKAGQAIVCALERGTESHYEAGERLARRMFSPVLRSHRVTVEQMAMLEPTMAETVSSMLAVLMGEAMEEAVARGVPHAAARDFFLGHVNIQLAIVFGEAGNPFSDACKVAIEYGRRFIIRDGWRELFAPERVREQIDVMLHPEKLEATMAKYRR